MTTQQELLNDIQSKLQLLSTTSTVEERIKKEIQELKDDFEEAAKNYEYTTYIGHDNPTYESFLKIFNNEGFGAEALLCLDTRYSLYFDDVESLVEMVNDFERRFLEARYEIRKLEGYLEGE